MKAAFAPLGFALGASAALIPRDQCCFSLNASGGQSGALGQLGDGQNRVGQSGGLATQQATYCLNNGGLTDQNGRGCILTPPTTQFQCDAGASPTTGFAVNSNGDLTYNGNTQFYACQTGDNGGYNIYTTTTSSQSGCVQVTLNTGGKCATGGGQGSSSAPASASQPAGSQPAGSQPAGSQPASSAPATQPAGSQPAGSQPASSQPATQPAGSQPAGSQPASSQPATQPAGSQPAGSQPAGSQPATQPAGSQPAGSQPAGSQPVGPQTQTVYSTQYQTITSCGPNVKSCPAQSTVVYSTSVPVGGNNGPAPSSSGYACNPAHSYPNGASCVSTNGGLSLVTPQPSASQPAGSQPAGSQPAASAATTGYACNPAHSYPNGAACVSTNGGLSLVTPKPTGSQPAASQPANSQPAGSQPANSQPAASQPANSQPAGSQPAGSQPASSAPAASGTTGGKACQTSLTGAYQTPHAIIPVNQNQPSKSYGTQYFAYVGSGNSTIFNFDIPQDYSGKQCSVIFLFPKKSDLETSSFTQSGSGGLKFDQLTSAAGLDVSYQSTPAVKSNLGSVDNVTPGNSYVVSTGSCQAGSTQSIQVSGTGNLGLSFFEDWNPSPIGVFITSC